MRRTVPGAPHPLGATLDPEGVNFGRFSENASVAPTLRIAKIIAEPWHVGDGGRQVLFTGEEVELGPNARLSELFQDLPVALLHQVMGRRGR
ncbi:MAG: hypothetical protein ABIQ16_23050 [Polyangiaceae bacterium]